MQYPRIVSCIHYLTVKEYPKTSFAMSTESVKFEKKSKKKGHLKPELLLIIQFLTSVFQEFSVRFITK